MQGFGYFQEAISHTQSAVALPKFCYSENIAQATQWKLGAEGGKIAPGHSLGGVEKNWNELEKILSAVIPGYHLPHLVLLPNGGQDGPVQLRLMRGDNFKALVKLT